jgi:hypothetical protein
MKPMTIWSFFNPLFLLLLLTFYANHKGSEGVVHVGTSAIAELRGWNLDETAEVIEDTILSDSARTYKPGNTGWTGGATCWWDETDTSGQKALTIGAEVSLTFYGEGSGTGKERFSGSGIVTGVSNAAAINGIVEQNFTFQGNGALTRGTS